MGFGFGYEARSGATGGATGGVVVEAVDAADGSWVVLL